MNLAILFPKILTQNSAPEKINPDQWIQSLQKCYFLNKVGNPAFDRRRSSCGCRWRFGLDGVDVMTSAFRAATSVYRPSTCTKNHIVLLIYNKFHIYSVGVHAVSDNLIFFPAPNFLNLDFLPWISRSPSLFFSRNLKLKERRNCFPFPFFPLYILPHRLEGNRERI